MKCNNGVSCVYIMKSVFANRESGEREAVKRSESERRV